MIKVLFMGRKEVSARCLRYLHNSDAFEVIGVLTDSHLSNSVTAEIAHQCDIPVLEHKDVATRLREKTLAYDLGLSMLYWRILKGPFLTAPALGTINFHPAPLPQYKGTAGYNLAILESRSDWAASAHYVDESIDTGPIIKVNSFAIDDQFETALTLERKSQEILFSLFEEVVSKYENGEKFLSTTPNGPGRYVSRVEMEEMKEIKPEDDIARKIRAFWFPPYDGAYILMDGTRYTLVDRTILESLVAKGTTSLFTK